MSKKFTPLEEVRQTIETLKDKPEIDNKVKFYKGVLIATDAKVKAIGERIERGYTTETFKFLGVPINKKIMLDTYDVAKLEIEKLDAESQLYYQQQYFENWLKRSREYDIKFGELTKECEQFFDTMHTEASALREHQPRLNQVMAEYKNPNNDNKLKVEYYLYLKQEVENHKQFGKKRFAPTN